MECNDCKIRCEEYNDKYSVCEKCTKDVMNELQMGDNDTSVAPEWFKKYYKYRQLEETQGLASIEEEWEYLLDIMPHTTPSTPLKPLVIDTRDLSEMLKCSCSYTFPRDIIDITQREYCPQCSIPLHFIVA